MVTYNVYNLITFMGYMSVFPQNRWYYGAPTSFNLASHPLILKFEHCFTTLAEHC